MFEDVINASNEKTDTNISNPPNNTHVPRVGATVTEAMNQQMFLFTKLSQIFNHDLLMKSQQRKLKA